MDIWLPPGSISGYEAINSDTLLRSLALELITTDI